MQKNILKMRTAKCATVTASSTRAHGEAWCTETRTPEPKINSQLCLLLGTLIHFYQSKCLVVPEAALPVRHSIRYLSNLPAITP